MEEFRPPWSQTELEFCQRIIDKQLAIGERLSDFELASLAATFGGGVGHGWWLRRRGTLRALANHAHRTYEDRVEMWMKELNQDQKE